ncbi:perlucin-like [Haliotis rubra]|uniref:perlucin-like n=1 Tax=Haliotis rubra TaxID=36100 RepID=UPI001EE5E7C0|nr:perlucin-like [Haliotis rubra]
MKTMRLETLSFLLLSLAPVVAGYHGCPHGFVRWERSCYLFSRISKTFWEAKQYCHHIGSHLVIVTTRCEQYFLNRQAKANVYWLGATDIHKEGVWKWGDSHVMVYSNWCPGQPDNGHGTEHCLQMLKTDWQYQWNDDQCYNRFPFICEKEV